MHHPGVPPRPATKCPSEEWPSPWYRRTRALPINIWPQLEPDPWLTPTGEQGNSLPINDMTTTLSPLVLVFFFFLLFCFFTSMPSVTRNGLEQHLLGRAFPLPFSCSSSLGGLSGVRHLECRGCPRALNENYPLPAWKVAEINQETPSLSVY